MKMRRTTKICLIAGITIVIIIFPIWAHFFTKSYHEDVKKLPKRYAYQTYWGPPNDVLLITDLDDKDNLVNYYKRVESGANPSFNFPLKTIPKSAPVYVMEYSNDSLLAKIYCYYDFGPMNGGNHTKGWVYAKTLHVNPPAVSSDSIH